MKNAFRFMLKGSFAFTPSIAFAFLACEAVSPQMLSDTIAPTDFEFIGTVKQGKVVLKTTKVLAQQLEVRYFVGETISFNDIDFKEEIDATLTNGDVVYAKLFVKDLEQNRFEIQAQAIKMVVSGLEKTMINATLAISDFTFSGVHEAGVVSLSSTKVLPSEVEVRYFSNQTSAPTSDESFQTSPPTFLKNGDNVYVKLFVKSTLRDEWQVNDTLVTLFVQGLTKRTISPALSTLDFEISGLSGAATIGPRQGFKLHTALVLKYFKGASEPTDELSYQEQLSAGISNNDVIWIKPFVISSQANNYDVNAPVLSLQASNLIVELGDQIASSDFNISGLNGVGTITLQKTDLASQLEVRYFVGSVEPTSLDAYSKIQPANLSNGSQVYARLFVKDGFETGYAIGKKVAVITVRDLKILLTSTINALDFVFSGDDLVGSITLKANVTIANELEVRYFIGSSAPSDLTSFLATKPTNLANGNTIWLRLFVKPAYEATHTINAQAFSTVVSNLTRRIVIFESDFAFSGARSGLGTITIKDPSILSQYGKILYAVTRGVRPNPSAFSETAPTTLENGDRVWMKVVKGNNAPSTIVIPENMIAKTVQGLAKNQITADFKADDFLLVGPDSQGEALATRAISRGMIRYYKGEVMPTNDSQYQDVLYGLNNGDKVWAKVFVALDALENVEFSDSAISKVASLSNKTLDDNLKVTDIVATSSTQTKGALSLKNGALISSKLEVRFAKSTTTPANDNAYSAIIINLVSGDQIYAKLFLKSTSTGYTISATPKNFKVYYELKASEFVNVTVGDIILAEGITSIPNNWSSNAIFNESLVLPSTVVSIGEKAFLGSDISQASSLFKIVIDLQSLGAYAFTNNEQKTLSLSYNFSLPTTITTFSIDANGDSYLFSQYHASLSFVIPPLVQTLPNYVLSGVTLYDGFQIPSSITSISSNALANVQLPIGRVWFGPNHLKLSDQTTLIPGSYVGWDTF